ncbi:WD40 repeat-like protein [Aspergillus fijiensis CBS 313.89]|uniref:WD40 repeat-like protein n=1 Tax=Aspergillus fijiensis CBS 313.89 TaxID=1448319 RepID=A0A8G1W304_9EURO|nr:WD40 repeat-like protein [Aspergillus fijiensis CBS 313.89]RAK81228.1 WD40 repeat-like protein [Aspergillus fijiensis CBS 313.89]
MRRIRAWGQDSSERKHETPEHSDSKEKRSIKDRLRTKFSSRHYDDDEIPKRTGGERSSCLEPVHHGHVPSRPGSASDRVETPRANSASLRESTKTLEELVMKNLWQVALEELREKEGRLVAAYEQDLAEVSNKNRSGDKQVHQQLVREALQRLEDGQLVIPRRCRHSAIGNHVQRIVQIVLSVKDVISQAVSAEPHASLAWAGVLVVLPLLLKPFTQLEEAANGIEFISRLLIRYQIIQGSHLQVFIVPPVQSESMTSVDSFCSSIREQTIALYTQVLEYQIRLARQFSRSGLFQGIRDLVTADDWLGMTTKIKQTDGSIHTMLAEWSQKTILHIDKTVSSLQEKMDESLSLSCGIKQDMNIHRNETLLKSITCVTGAAYGFYDQDKGTCLEGTQVAVLEKIQNWSIGPEEKPILWLQGMAGTGKSTIARTAAASFRNGTSLTNHGALPDNVCLGGSFFFDHKKQDCKDPRNLFPTLARQLVEVIPEIQESVCAAISNHHDIQQRTLRDQWRYLIWEPLSMLQSDLRDTVIVVIDALDECEVKANNCENDVEVILGLLSQIQKLHLVRIRVLITSRPEADMQRHSRSLSKDIHDQTLEKVKLVNDTDDREDDITRLVKHEMIAIKKSHPRLPADWPGTQSLRQLVVQTEGLFIYATTVCRFLRGATEQTIQRRLETILGNKFDGNSKGNNLDEMYTRILEIILTGEADNDAEMSSLFKQVVGCIIVLSQPMSLIDLGHLIPCNIHDIEWALEQLRSVIEVPQDSHQHIQLVHLSFRDYLLDHSRCKNDLFYLEEKERNHVVFAYCLDLMTRYLRRDICCLREPGIELSQINLESSENKKRFPDSVRYACIYWVEHLERSGDASSADEARTLDFLQAHFTHWLEAMCLMEMMPHVIKIFRVLTSMNMSERMGKFLFDARKFTSNFRMHIEKMPLQIYISALTCAPQNSIIRNLFGKEIPAWITQLSVAQSDWDAYSHSLPILAWVRSVEFSPDNKLLVVISSFKIWLFETATWTCVLEINGADSSPLKIIFSPNSTSLAVIFEHGNARLWHVCDRKWMDLEAQLERIVGIQFSGDGRELVCLLDDNTMTIANGQTGNILAKLSHGVTAFRLLQTNLAVSDDGRFIAIVDNTSHVNVFDQNRGSVVYNYYAVHGINMRSMSFSRDGRHLLSASSDGYVKLWDSKNNEHYEINTGYSILQAVFLADTAAVAIAHEDLTVSRWTWMTMKTERQGIEWPLEDISAYGNCEFFFHQSGPVATCMMGNGDDGVWKNIRTTCAQIKHKSPYVTAIAISPNGRLIASRRLESVSIWEVSAREVQSQSADDGTVFSVEVSPEGNTVAWSSSNGVRLWKAYAEEYTEIQFGTPAFTGIRRRPHFSADGRMLILFSNDGQIRLLDVTTGQLLASIQLSNAEYLGIDLSRDKTLLALAWKKIGERGLYVQITLWDLAKNQAFREFKVDMRTPWEPMDVVISPNGSTIAVSTIGNIRVYTSAGTIIHTLKDEGSFSRLAFSANGELIASADRKITIWNTATIQKLKEIPCPGGISWISFTDEDRFLSTSQGRFSIASILSNDDDVDGSGSGLYCRDLYIMNGRKTILALNPELTASTPSVRGNKIALVFPPDRVGIFEIDTEVDQVL